MARCSVERGGDGARSPLAVSSYISPAALSRLPPACRLKESRPALLRALNDGLVPRKAGGKLSEEPPEKLRAEAAQAVWAELGAKCIYVTTVRRGGDGLWGARGVPARLAGVCPALQGFERRVRAGMLPARAPPHPGRFLLADAPSCAVRYHHTGVVVVRGVPLLAHRPISHEGAGGGLTVLFWVCL